jgi:uncharacterized OB-fold protein
VARALLAASIARPAWQVGPYRIEGPDEDPFTLAVAAIDPLEEDLRRGLGKTGGAIHLVGSFPTEADWAIGEALDLPDEEIRRYPAGPGGWWSAIAAAVDEPDSERWDVVVAADVAGPGVIAPVPPSAAPLFGAAGVAVLAGPGSGLAMLGHAARGHPPHRDTGVRALLTAWLDRTGLTAETAEIVVAGGEGAERLKRSWGTTGSAIRLEAPRPETLRQLGPAPTVASALLLWDLVGRLREGGLGAVVEIGRDRSTFAAVRWDAPVRWIGPWIAPSEGVPTERERLVPATARLDAVSQGAYVPHARYVENLPSRWRLVAERCGRCGRISFPARGRCRACGETERLAREALPRTGARVEAVTTVSAGAQPTEFDPQVDAQGSYDVAIVEVAPGVRVTAQVADARPGRVRIGDRVHLALRRLYAMEGEWRYGLKALPSDAATTAGPGVSGRPAPSSEGRSTARRPTTRRSSSPARSGSRRARPRTTRAGALRT